jgi:hypothetical protein
MGRKAPRKRLTCRVISAFTRVLTGHGMSNGCLARTRTFLGAPPTPRFRGARSKAQTPGANCAAGTKKCGLFDIVRCDSTATVRRRAASAVAVIVCPAGGAEMWTHTDEPSPEKGESTGAGFVPGFCFLLLFTGKNRRTIYSQLEP